VSLPLGLTHSGRGEGNDDGIAPEEGEDGDPADLHVELLLLLLVDFAFGFVNLKEVLDHGLIDVMADGVFDFLHVMVEFGGSPRGIMGVVAEELADQSLRLVLFEEE
jgi:hypothetical protein